MIYQLKLSYTRLSMNFKTHRKNRSFLIAHSERQRPERKSFEIAQQPSPAIQILEEGRHAYYKEKDFRKAIQLFEKYLSLYPKTNEVMYLCGVAFLQISRSQEAIEKLKLVTKQYENYANALLLIAIAFNKLGCLSKSFQFMDICIRHYPKFQEALCFRGRLHMQNGCFMQAEIDFRTAVGLVSASFLGFTGLGDVFRATNRFEKAIKLYQKAQQMTKVSHLQQNSKVFYELQLKMAICLYFLQENQKCLQKLCHLKQIEPIKGLCYCKLEQREKALLNLQYSLKLQTNKQIAEKAYKRLLRLYLQNSQFYEAINIVDLGEKCSINLSHWSNTVKALMMVIKGHYKQALSELQFSLSFLKEERDSKMKIKGSVIQLSSLHNPIKVKSINPPKRLNFFDSPLNKEKIRVKSKSGRRKSDFYSKSVAKAIAKIGSMSNCKNTVRMPNDILRHKTEHFASEIVKTAPFKQSIDPPIQYFNAKERQLMYPLILKFKAYAEFFLDEYLASTDTYELYDNFMKDMYGKDSELHYNKLLCEGMLMTQEELADEALAKFSECVEYYFQKYHQVPIEPILYKLALLIKLAVVKFNDEEGSEEEDPDVANSTEILDSTLKMMENYKTAISDSHLSFYFKAIILILQDDYRGAQEHLEKALKLAEECTWKYLYVKGVVEMTLGNYFGAIKQFSAGLILEVRPQLYLGRCICFFMLSQQARDKMDEDDMKNLMKSVNISAQLTQQIQKIEHFSSWKQKTRGEVLIESCFSDLQSFVQLSKNEKQISIWVSRILFATKSFDEALSSIVKMDNCPYEFMQMTECIEIYEGEYEDGGSVGLIIKSAFDGLFLDEQQKHNLLQESTIKNYNSPQFEYLTKQYQKWLIILNLYVKDEYPLLLKYMQRELFTVKDDITEIFLRYNICIVYLLMGESSKANHLVKSLLKFQFKFKLGQIISKMLEFQYDQDQCLDQLRQCLGIGDSRLLSNFLPYREVYLVNHKQTKIKIFLRVNLPFPKFPLPNLQLKIDRTFILSELGPKIIAKKIEAPWIRRTENNVIQFTENLLDSKTQSISLSSVSGSASRLLEEENN